MKPQTAVLSLFVLALSSQAIADSSEPRPATIERSGFIGGIALGGGGLGKSCDSCDSLGGLALELQLGWILHPRFALLYDGGGIVASTEEGFGGTAALVMGASAQTWATDALWFKVTAGLGDLKVREGVFGQQERNDRAFGLAVGSGYTLTNLGRSRIDARVRVGVGFHDPKTVMTMAALVGLQWY